MIIKKICQLTVLLLLCTSYSALIFGGASGEYAMYEFRGQITGRNIHGVLVNPRVRVLAAIRAEDLPGYDVPIPEPRTGSEDDVDRRGMEALSVPFGSGCAAACLGDDYCTNFCDQCTEGLTTRDAHHVVCIQEDVFFANTDFQTVDRAGVGLRFFLRGGLQPAWGMNLLLVEQTQLAGTTDEPGYEDSGRFDYGKLNTPTGLALSPDGRTLYVADTGNAAIRAICLGGDVGTPECPRLRTVAGGSVPTIFDDDTTAFLRPVGLVVADDGSGDRLIIADEGNQSIYSLPLNPEAPRVHSLLKQNIPVKWLDAATYDNDAGDGIHLLISGGDRVQDAIVGNGQVRTVVTLVDEVAGAEGITVDEMGLIYFVEGNARRVRRLNRCLQSGVEGFLQTFLGPDDPDASFSSLPENLMPRGLSFSIGSVNAPTVGVGLEPLRGAAPRRTPDDGLSSCPSSFRHVDTHLFMTDPLVILYDPVPVDGGSGR